MWCCLPNQVFFYLPQNCLSAVVLIALTNLIDLGVLKWLLVNSVKDAFVWVGTDCYGLRWIASDDPRMTSLIR